ncbi:hypothetical protein ANSO36C_14000 [Nostoc cf. commune SO-36]|uniref:Transposase n=1 Tax=Nostoc cf. commune SO-36 TaxID=449208 RepID=A0ABN6PX26_NOSCO|nr:hypothetical protein ANSO36C_14000 [Nostoc cf. commune SO-36]
MPESNAKDNLYLGLTKFFKLNQKTYIFWRKYKIQNKPEISIQKIFGLREPITNFEILHKHRLYVTIWMVLDGS